MTCTDTALRAVLNSAGPPRSSGSGKQSLHKAGQPGPAGHRNGRSPFTHTATRGTAETSAYERARSNTSSRDALAAKSQGGSTLAFSHDGLCVWYPPWLFAAGARDGATRAGSRCYAFQPPARRVLATLNAGDRAHGGTPSSSGQSGESLLPCHPGPRHAGPVPRACSSLPAVLPERIVSGTVTLSSESALAALARTGAPRRSPELGGRVCSRAPPDSRRQTALTRPRRGGRTRVRRPGALLRCKKSSGAFDPRLDR